LRLARRHVLHRETRGQAAQKEGAQAENGRLRRTDLMVSHHKNHYSGAGKVLQMFFLPQISQVTRILIVKRLGFLAAEGTESTEGFSQLGVLGKIYSQSELCHKLLPSSTRALRMPY